MARHDDLVAGRPQFIRAMNERLLVSAIRREGPRTVAELMAISSLSKPTVGQTTSNLEELGVIRAIGVREGGRGPKAQVYDIAPDAGYVLALDVGAMFVRGALSTVSGELLAQASRRIDRPEEYHGTPEVISLGTSLLRSGGKTVADLTQTVVGTPGFYNEADDSLFLANNLNGWEEPGVVGELRRAFGERTVVQNDVNLAAVAESRRGHGQGVHSFAFLSVGSGLALGLVIGDQAYTGAHLAAGEIGYLPYALLGPAKPRAARHTLESLGSGRGIVARAQARGFTGEPTAPAVFRAAAEGDGVAQEVIREEAEIVAHAVATISAVVDPALIVLGGGVGRVDGFAERVHAAVAEIFPIVPDITTTALGENSVVEGAIEAGIDLAWEELLKS